MERSRLGRLKSRGLKKITQTGLTAMTRKWRVNKTPRRVLLTTHGQTGDADGFTRITNRFPALTKGKIFSHVYFILRKETLEHFRTTIL